MKYPPFSWLRLGDEIRKAPSRMWFSFNRLPKKQETCRVLVQIGGGDTLYADPYDVISGKCEVLPRERSILAKFLRIAKPTRTKSEFQLDHIAFSTLLPFCDVIPFEVTGSGVITMAKQSGRIKAFLTNAATSDAFIKFSLIKRDGEKIVNPIFFGDINAYAIDDELKLYRIMPSLTQSEVEAILNSPPLPLLGLRQKESRQMFYALSRLGLDLNCLDEVAKAPERSEILLRLLLKIDDISKKVCARAHLVTHLIDGDFSDEVEIRSTQAIPAFHLKADPLMDEERFIDDAILPVLLKRPATQEQDARIFLYKHDASPARLHDGFELLGEKAVLFLRTISKPGGLPHHLTIDEDACPRIIDIVEPPTLKVRSAESTPRRVEVSLSLSPEFDKTGAEFSQVIDSNDDFIVLDEDNLILIDAQVKAIAKYLCEALNLKKPGDYKDKSIAQIALMLNSFSDKVTIAAEPALLSFLQNFAIIEKGTDRALPLGLKTELRPYQHDAVAWLSALHRAGLGGLLGDEMGLGKTLMVLVHLARLKEFESIKEPALVVCPTSVIDVWREEAKQHLPHLKVIKWHGPERFGLETSFCNADIVVTSYALLRRDLDNILKKQKFSTLVLDEAQYVRNQQTDSFRSAKAIRCNHRIALTGTPIENHLSDLYNILDCVEDGILGTYSRFESQFITPIEAGLSYRAAGLKILLSPIITRRKKAEVESELPEKIESIIHCKLSSAQKELYKKYVAQIGQSLGQNLSQERKGGAESHFSMLSALTRLRQICCHPALILGNGSQLESGKLNALRDVMSECLAMGRKIIIYSQFLKMQERIVKVAEELDSQGALWLHGGTKDRHDIVQKFQQENGPRMIVVSLKAGGTGITLTEADTVIFADPWWNPAVEDQAVDRAHRIGQKKAVHVIRIIVEDSIEGEVVALAHKKRLIAKAIIDEGFKAEATFSKEEIQGLLLRELERLTPQFSDDVGDDSYD